MKEGGKLSNYFSLHAYFKKMLCHFFRWLLRWHCRILKCSCVKNPIEVMRLDVKSGKFFEIWTWGNFFVCLNSWVRVNDHDLQNFLQLFLLNFVNFTKGQDTSTVCHFLQWLKSEVSWPWFYYKRIIFNQTWN